MTDLEQTWKLFYEPGSVLEVRALGLSGRNKRWSGYATGVVAGYFDNQESFIDCVSALDEYGKAEAIYITLNPLNPDLLARSNNRLVGGGKGATAKDEDVLRRRWLMVDVDPTRPSGISATDAELNYALSTADKIKEKQLLAGWSKPVVAMSGNGIHLLWCIDLPNDESTKNLVSSTLKNLTNEFSNEHASVDILVFNAARITKCYGTHARKGDETATRKHRQSTFLEIPESIVPISSAFFDGVEVPVKSESKQVDYQQTDLSLIESALQALPAHFGSTGEGYIKWLQVQMAVHAEMGDSGIALIEKYMPGKPGEVAAKFASFTRTDVGIGTLFHIASEYGWKYPRLDIEPAYDGYFYTNGFDFESAVTQKSEPKKLATLELKQRRYESTMMLNEDNLPSVVGKDPLFSPSKIFESVEDQLLNEHIDDEGNARCTNALYEGRFLYSAKLGWLNYTGTHWAIVDNEIVERAITETLIKRAELALRRGAQQYQYLIKSCVRNHGKVTGIRGQLQSLVSVDVSEFDSNPDVFNCVSGAIDLRTGELTPHSNEQRFLSCSPVAYRPNADYSHWVEWLAEATSKETADYLQMAVGYTLSGYTSEEVLFYVYGPPRSGKGTFTDAMMGIMGDEMGKSVPFYLFTARNEVDGQNFAFAPLQAARFIAASESNKNERFNEGKVKTVTGGDKIRCCFKGKDQFDYRPKFKIWLTSNNPVNADPDDEAVWGRIRVVKFPISHLGEEDKTLKRKMTTKKYLEGVLLWAIEGAIKWYQLGAVGLPELGEHKQEKLQHRESQDSVSVWFNESYQPSQDHENDYIASSVVYNNYKDWCESTGHKPLNINNLTQKLKQKYGASTAKKYILLKQERVIVGIKML